MTTLSLFLLNAYLPASFLAISAAVGFGLVVFLFLLCFLIVHILILIRMGWNAQEKSQPPKEEEKTEEKKAPESKPMDREPIYYIVERKRTRPKQKYGEPKEIRFK